MGSRLESGGLLLPPGSCLGPKPGFSGVSQVTSLMSSYRVVILGGYDYLYYITMYFGNSFSMESSHMGVEGSDRAS